MTGDKRDIKLARFVGELLQEDGEKSGGLVREEDRDALLNHLATYVTGPCSKSDRQEILNILDSHIRKGARWGSDSRPELTAQLLDTLVSGAAVVGQPGLNLVKKHFLNYSPEQGVAAINKLLDEGLERTEVQQTAVSCIERMLNAGNDHAGTKLFIRQSVGALLQNGNQLPEEMQQAILVDLARHGLPFRESLAARKQCINDVCKQFTGQRVREVALSLGKLCNRAVTADNLSDMLLVSRYLDHLLAARRADLGDDFNILERDIEKVNTEARKFNQQKLLDDHPQAWTTMRNIGFDRAS